MFSPRVFAEIDARASGCAALRQFLAHLLARGIRIAAAPMGKTLDVDRPQDIAAAEASIAQRVRRVIDFLGIARERVYSPGKVADDRAILGAVAAHLATRHRVAVVSADEPLPDVAPPTVVFAMCQGPAALATLRRWEAAGVRVINTVAGMRTPTAARARRLRARPRAAPGERSCWRPQRPPRCRRGSTPAPG
ncbi:MAG: hypothetical protein U0802_04385 [Candidatus Binatia bacterium]